MIDDKNIEEAQPSETQEENIDNESSEVDAEQSDGEAEEESTIDYKGELERLQGELDKKDKKLSQARYNLAKIRVEEKQDTTESQINSDDIARMVEEQVTARMGAVEQTALVSTIDTLVSQQAESPDEAALIKHHLTHTLSATGDLSERVTMAKVLANRNRMTQQLSEAKRALASKGNTGNGAGAGQKQSQTRPPQLAPKDAQLIKSAKMKWNSDTERYEGKFTALKYNQATGGWESISLRNQ